MFCCDGYRSLRLSQSCRRHGPDDLLPRRGTPEPNRIALILSSADYGDPRGTRLNSDTTIRKLRRVSPTTLVGSRVRCRKITRRFAPARKVGGLFLLIHRNLHHRALAGGRFSIPEDDVRLCGDDRPGPGIFIGDAAGLRARGAESEDDRRARRAFVIFGCICAVARADCSHPGGITGPFIPRPSRAPGIGIVCLALPSSLSSGLHVTFV